MRMLYIGDVVMTRAGDGFFAFVIKSFNNECIQAFNFDGEVVELEADDMIKTDTHIDLYSICNKVAQAKIIENV